MAPLAKVSSKSGVKIYLVGGNAVELVCGGNVREYDDIDFSVRVADAGAAMALLERLGFVYFSGSVGARNVFHKRGRFGVGRTACT